MRTTTIGFNAVPALLAGRVAGATAFWDVEGVALRRRRPGFREFRVDEFGAPAYPELVLCVTHADAARQARARARDRRARCSAATGSRSRTRNRAPPTCCRRGPGRVARRRSWPSSTCSTASSPGRPACRARSTPGCLRDWARWEAQFGITRRPSERGRDVRHALRERVVERLLRTAAAARSLLRAHLAERLARGLRPAPHLHDLGAARRACRAGELAVDAGLVEQAQRAVDGRRRGRVAEAVRDEDAPVPLVVGQRLGVDLDEVAARRRCSARRRGCAARARGRSSRRAASRRWPGSRRRGPWLGAYRAPQAQPKNVSTSRKQFSAMIIAATTRGDDRRRARG